MSSTNRYLRRLYIVTRCLRPEYLHARHGAMGGRIETVRGVTSHDVPERAVALLVRLFVGFALPILETVIGETVLLGFRTRFPLTVGAFLRLALMFGSTHRQAWQIAAIQFVYPFLSSILIATSRINGYSLNQIFGGSANSL